MHYDQSWMGTGIVGAVEAGAVSAVVAVLLFVGFHWFGRRNGWGNGPTIGWTFLLTLLLTASGDLWDMVYFNYAPLQSVQLLRAKLAEVHDPENIGMRVLCEFAGVGLGIWLGWWIAAVCANRIRRPPR